MDYEKIYNQLITRGQIRQCGKNRKILKNEIGLVEDHHIIPRSIGGNNDKNNRVFLTPEEHVVAHLLLVKIYNKPELIYAANWMTNRIQNNKEYGWIKRQTATVLRNNLTGKPRSEDSKEKQSNTVKEKYKNGYISGRVGMPLTKEHKEKISIANKGKVIETKSKSDLNGYILRYGVMEGTKQYNIDSKLKDSWSLDACINRHGTEIGPIKYKEHCNMLSISLSGENGTFFGKVHSQISRDKISKSSTGKPKTRTKEHNIKIGKANTGRKHTLITCPYCNKEGGCTTMRRWHFDNCKDRPGGPLIDRKIQPIMTCPCCNKSGNGPRMKSDHFDNCKHRLDK